MSEKVYFERGSLVYVEEGIDPFTGERYVKKKMIRIPHTSFIFVDQVTFEYLKDRKQQLSYTFNTIQLLRKGEQKLRSEWSRIQKKAKKNKLTVEDFKAVEQIIKKNFAVVDTVVAEGVV